MDFVVFFTIDILLMFDFRHGKTPVFEDRGFSYYEASISFPPLMASSISEGLMHSR